MIINTIYLSYQGEVNIKGIGAPVIFLRTGGCHLRCYKDTLGILCDTPEALERNAGVDMSTKEIVDKVNSISDASGGVKLICLSGGDPLWRSPDELHDLFWALGNANYHISVETSGTLSIAKYKIYSWASWVLDYKLKSAGVKQKFLLSDLAYLNNTDIIKFVIYDEEDYNQFVEAYNTIRNINKSVVIAVGCYWGGKISNSSLFNALAKSRLLGDVTFNVQLHKMITVVDLNADLLHSTEIPKEI